VSVFTWWSSLITTWRGPGTHRVKISSDRRDDSTHPNRA